MELTLGKKSIFFSSQFSYSIMKAAIEEACQDFTYLAHVNTYVYAVLNDMWSVLCMLTNSDLHNSDGLVVTPDFDRVMY